MKRETPFNAPEIRGFEYRRTELGKCGGFVMGGEQDG
jgi:hypothetical protein